MKLSELVRLKIDLLDISTDSVSEHVDHLDAKVSSITNQTMHSDYRAQLNFLLKNISMIEDSIKNINQVALQLINNIDQEINEKTKNFNRRGYIISGEYGSNSTDVATERLTRQMPILDSTRADVINVIREKTDWHYPVLEIGPGDGEWTEYLVAGDPLYLVDTQPEFLESTKNKFNDAYQKRVRTYLTGGWANKSDFDLSELPKNQFGFIFSWNVFNYFPEHETELMLTQCYELLRPGGTMIFSYNNCELSKCAEFCESGFRSWMPAKLLTSICKKLNFEIIHHYTTDETFSWIEIRKPGKLKTVKAHQVLGKIINRNT